MTDVDLAAAAALLHRSYSWLQRRWRGLVATAGFPAPFVGAARGASPWWRAAEIEAWKAGARFDGAPQSDLSPVVAPAQPSTTVANDVRPREIRAGGRVAQLLAAAGGR